jgi:uncharacterized protein YbcI
MKDFNKLSMDSDINLSKKILDDLCLKYRLIMQKVQSVLTKGDIRFTHAITEPNWETTVLQMYDLKHAIELRASKSVLSKMVMDFVTTSLEKHYNERIKYSTFTVIKIDNRYELFSISIFKNPIFNKPNGMVSKVTEDQMASAFAKRMRELTGRGPQQCKTIVMSNNVVIYTIIGFFSDGDKQMARTSEINIDYVEKIAQHNITEALIFLYSESQNTISNVIPIFDVENDMVTVIVLLNGKIK